MREAAPFLQALRDLASRPDASSYDIDAVLHRHLCTVLDDATRLEIAEYTINQVNYEAIKGQGRSAFWGRVLVAALDKQRSMMSERS